MPDADLRAVLADFHRQGGDAQRAGDALTAVLDLADEGGVGWYEWIAMPTATTHSAYVHENGNVYLPGGEFIAEDFLLAAAEGRAHRLIRAGEVRAAIAGALGIEEEATDAVGR